MLTTFNEVDMSEVISMRNQYKDEFLNKYGVKLGFMSFFVKACVIGLKNYPAINAESVEKSMASKAISIILFGGIVSAFLGPVVITEPSAFIVNYEYNPASWPFL